MTTLYWLYLLPVFARIMGCIGVLLTLFACYKFVEKPHYSVCKLDTSVYTYYGSPVFKNEADAQYVIDNPNFRDILDNIFKV